jgi:hypothetical protein
MNRDNASAVIWSISLGAVLCLLLGEALGNVSCNGKKVPPPADCGEEVDCDWFKDSNNNGELDPGEEVYQYPDSRCSGYDINPKPLVVQDCIDGDPGDYCVTAEDPIQCTFPHKLCDWVPTGLSGGSYTCNGATVIMDEETGEAVYSWTKTGVGEEECDDEP